MGLVLIESPRSWTATKMRYVNVVSLFKEHVVSCSSFFGGWLSHLQRGTWLFVVDIHHSLNRARSELLRWVWLDRERIIVSLSLPVTSHLPPSMLTRSVSFFQVSANMKI